MSLFNYCILILFLIFSATTSNVLASNTSAAICPDSYSALISKEPRKHYGYKLIVDLVKRLMRIQYDVRIHDYDKIPKKLPGQKDGTLFIFNHPAAIDPIIHYTEIWERFNAMTVLSSVILPKTGFGARLAKKLKPIIDPIEVAPVLGTENIEATRKDLDKTTQIIIAALKKGRNVGIHYAGEMKKGPADPLYGKSMVDDVTRLYPNIRIVLARMDGMWGNEFGYGQTADFPNYSNLGPKFLRNLLQWRFAPRTKVDLYYKEASDFPTQGTAEEKRIYTDAFLNSNLENNHYRRQTFLEPKDTLILPEPIMPRVEVKGDPKNVPSAIRELVYDYFKTLTDVSKLTDETDLQKDLGLDSLEIMEINAAFAPKSNVPLTTVGQVLLVAAGESPHIYSRVRPPDARWVRQLAKSSEADSTSPLTFSSISDALSWQYENNPNKIILGDTNNGYISYLELIQSAKTIANRLSDLTSNSEVVILMDNSIESRINYNAILLSGKIPRVIDSRLKSDELNKLLLSTPAENILMTRKTSEELNQTGFTFDTNVKNRFLYGEDLRSTSVTKQLKTYLASYTPSFLRRGVLHNINSQMTILPIDKNLVAVSNSRFINLLPLSDKAGLRASAISETYGIPQFISDVPYEGATTAKQVKFNNITHVFADVKSLSELVIAGNVEDLASIKVAVVKNSAEIPLSLMKLIRAKAPNIKVLNYTYEAQ